MDDRNVTGKPTKPRRGVLIFFSNTVSTRYKGAPKQLGARHGPAVKLSIYIYIFFF